MKTINRNKHLRIFVLIVVGIFGRKGITYEDMVFLMRRDPILNDATERELRRAINYQRRKGYLRKNRHRIFEAGKIMLETKIQKDINKMPKQKGTAKILARKYGTPYHEIHSKAKMQPMKHRVRFSRVVHYNKTPSIHYYPFKYSGEWRLLDPRAGSESTSKTHVDMKRNQTPKCCSCSCHTLHCGTEEKEKNKSSTSADYIRLANTKKANLLFKNSSKSTNFVKQKKVLCSATSCSSLSSSSNEELHDQNKMEIIDLALCEMTPSCRTESEESFFRTMQEGKEDPLISLGRCIKEEMEHLNSLEGEEDDFDKTSIS